MAPGDPPRARRGETIMEPQHGMPASEAGPGTPAASAIDRYDVALEPGQAWCLKGLLGEPDEIVIPGLLLDDLGNCSAVEARMPVPTFYQMLAMVALAGGPDARRPRSTRARAHPARGQCLAPRRLPGRRAPRDRDDRALDRVVVDAYGAHRLDSLRRARSCPDQRAWR
jgi:hypothetical protein